MQYFHLLLKFKYKRHNYHNRSSSNKNKNNSKDDVKNKVTLPLYLMNLKLELLRGMCACIFEKNK